MHSQTSILWVHSNKLAVPKPRRAPSPELDHDLRLRASRTVGDKILLFLRYPVQSIVLHQSEWTETAFIPFMGNLYARKIFRDKYKSLSRDWGGKNGQWLLVGMELHLREMKILENLNLIIGKPQIKTIWQNNWSYSLNLKVLMQNRRSKNANSSMALAKVLTSLGLGFLREKWELLVFCKYIVRSLQFYNQEECPQLGVKFLIG